MPEAVIFTVELVDDGDDDSEHTLRDCHGQQKFKCLWETLFVSVILITIINPLKMNMNQRQYFGKKTFPKQMYNY
ncbi:hypothetical protein DERF_007672 [Dermatophagoides farinae]|nr:hypothetical protein DERF_007672 [Dermatophagoides farinae]